MSINTNLLLFYYLLLITNKIRFTFIIFVHLFSIINIVLNVLNSQVDMVYILLVDSVIDFIRELKVM